MKNPVFDKDLTPLFQQCDNSDLDPIVQSILDATSQTLTVKAAYREHTGDHKSYIDELVYEIQSFGGNTLANLVRGHGVSYAEMVRDVAKKLGVRASMVDDTSLLEEKILLRIIKLSYDMMDETDRAALADLFNLGNETDQKLEFGGEFPEAEISRHLAESAGSLLGDRIQHAVEIATRSARIRGSLIAAGKALMAKVATASLGGPLSWTAAIGQSVYDLFGPSYGTVLALVSHVGLLRQKCEQLARDRGEMAEDPASLATQFTDGVITRN